MGTFEMTKLCMRELNDKEELEERNNEMFKNVKAYKNFISSHGNLFKVSSVYYFYMSAHFYLSFYCVPLQGLTENKYFLFSYI